MSIPQNNFVIKIKNATKLTDLVAYLVNSNYQRVEHVNYFGQFKVLGDRVILYPVNLPYIFHVDFYGNEIESIIVDGVESSLNQEISIAPNIIDDDGLRFEPGQYVVHLDHGVGLFKTLGMRETDSFVDKTQAIGQKHLQKQTNPWQPFLIIEYANGAELFVPPSQAGKLTHYIGKRHPALSALGSKRWELTRKKVEESIIKIARELLAVAAKRQINHRSAYNINREWMGVISSEFLFDETDDQQHAIDDCLTDLERNRPMDRLICGDVGFGKTEVAIRAAAAVLSCGKQVAILAPTTILAQQHFALLKQRFANLPVNIGLLSRFVDHSVQEKTVLDLANGTTDFVVGTHSLLQPNIQFKDLGMIIIDEEQRFGVKHKEHFKKLRYDVDVLTLSATPIPRTLFAGLSGLRDISLMSTPPKNRVSVITKVEKSNDDVIITAIKTECERGGQAFVLHNDVSSIEARAKVLRGLMPKVNIAVAHGQMPENKLASVMNKTVNGEIDVLLTSTIIENGLDIPNVNTLIVDKADHFGLSDLYQLRGRIGRSAKQAYAYFFYDKELTQTAKERFRALQDFEQLGSGYQIALKDLEIRGGGNVLGKEQHGNMEAIGLSLYTKMLKLISEQVRAGKKIVV
jgi:transcription-repair coupling factor (superfamily II helicase)